MDYGSWIKKSSAKLKATGISSAQLDALILLEDELKIDRAYILAHPEQSLSPAKQKKLNTKLVRRTQHEPLSYIRGKVEFYGRTFVLNQHVLEPRPESETMIELLKQLVVSRQSSVVRNLRIVDVGTGSGALGITAALEVGAPKVIILDIDPLCLDVAKLNAKAHGVNPTILQGDLLAPLKNVNCELLTVLLANLPYVPDGWHINEAAMREPKLAIFGGPDGLDLYRRLFEQINSYDWKPKFILCESMPPQHEALANIAELHGYQLVTSEDFIQVFEHN
jgi:release factor glutamine methyltransferase